VAADGTSVGPGWRIAELLSAAESVTHSKAKPPVLAYSLSAKDRIYLRTAADGLSRGGASAQQTLGTEALVHAGQRIPGVATLKQERASQYGCYKQNCGKNELVIQVAIELPEDIGQELQSKWKNLPAAVLEALALEGYRTGSLTKSQVRRMLGFETRMQVNQFLREHGIYYDYSQEELEAEIEDNKRLLADASPVSGTR
jgi:Uncharacterised protein family (UPF0175)